MLSAARSTFAISKYKFLLSRNFVVFTFCVLPYVVGKIKHSLLKNNFGALFVLFVPKRKHPVAR